MHVCVNERDEIHVCTVKHLVFVNVIMDSNEFGLTMRFFLAIENVINNICLYFQSNRRR